MGRYVSFVHIFECRNLHSFVILRQTKAREAEEEGALLGSANIPALKIQDKQECSC